MGRQPGAVGCRASTAARSGPATRPTAAASRARWRPIYARGVDLIARRWRSELRLRGRVLLAAVAVQQAGGAGRGARCAAGSAPTCDAWRAAQGGREARSRLRRSVRPERPRSTACAQPVMYDFVHTNERGARVIARGDVRAAAARRCCGWPSEQQPVNVLGISAFYHDSAAALVQDGELVAAAQEERFTRGKHDDGLPAERHPLLPARGRRAAATASTRSSTTTSRSRTFVRLLRTYLRVGPAGLRLVPAGDATVDAQEAVDPLPDRARAADLGYAMPERLYFTEHHESHAASAFFPSPFDSAAVLTFDGVGEWATSSIGVGRGQPHRRCSASCFFPNSIGLLYSAFTYHCGFRVNSGEYKLMGLAPYGEPRYADRILDELLDLREDGSFEMNMRYFGFLERPEDDQPPLRRALRRARARSPSREITQARDGPGRARSRRSPRRSCCGSPATPPRPRAAQRLPGRRRGAELRGQRRACCARGRSSGSGSSPPPGDAGGARRRRAARLAPDHRPPARGRPRIPTA